MSVTVDMNIVITYSLSVVVALHSYKFRGAFKTLILFFGAVVIGGGVENANAMFGGYHYPGSNLTLFLGLCPFDVVLGWFVILYCCSFFSHSLIAKGKGSYFSQGIGTEPENGIDKNFILLTLIRAILAGALAVNLDMFIDPVAVENAWWIWQIDNIYIQGVPIGNYLGWWVLISSSAFFYDVIITHGSLKRQEKWKTSLLWSIGTIVAALITGGILSQFVILLGLEGIRTEGLDTVDLATAMSGVQVREIVITIIVVIIGIGLIMLSSFAPDEAEPSEEKFWRILPSIIMIIFWAMVMLVAILTSIEMVIIGLIQPLGILLVSVYLIIRPIEK